MLSLEEVLRDWRADKEAERLINWLQEEAKTRGAKGYVVGLSGGIDSAVVAALCQRALPGAVLGLIMPCFSNPQDVEDARLVAEAFSLTCKEIVLDEAFAVLVKLFTGREPAADIRDLALVNIKPRLRMITLYYHASRLGYLVVGTGNRSELVIGYFTKYGDGGVDLLPLAHLVKWQVRELARYLGVPQRIIDRPPTAGLWAGQTDEGELGFTYAELDYYLLTGQGSERVKEKVEKLHLTSAHKRALPAMPPLNP